MRAKSSITGVPESSQWRETAQAPFLRGFLGKARIRHIMRCGRGARSTIMPFNAHSNLDTPAARPAFY